MPGRIINVNPIQTRKEGVFSLEVVLELNTTPGSGAPESEIKLPLPPVKLICHFNVSSERWVLIVGEDILEQGLEVTSLVINRYLSDFHLKWPPARYFAELLNKNALVSMFKSVHYAHRNSKWWTSLSCQDPFCTHKRWARGCSLSAYILPPMVQHQLRPWK